MPRDKFWLERVPEVREKLSVLPEDFTIDREFAESLFAVSSRTALRILETLGAQRDDSGRLVLSRATLLKGLAAGEVEAALAERQKRQQGRNDLLTLKHRFARRRHDPTFPLAESQDKWEIAHLPTAIQLQPGRVTVEFADIPDLLWQLEVLVASLSDDRQKAEKTLEPQKGRAV